MNAAMDHPPFIMHARCLIVDDDATDRELIALSLIQQWKIPEIDLELVKVGTLKEALEVSDSCNVTILDLGLPDSSQENTICSIPMFRPPVIVMTGSDDPEVMAACYANGAGYVFSKGAAVGFMTSIFASVQQDIVKRARGRTNVQ